MRAWPAIVASVVIGCSGGGHHAGDAGGGGGDAPACQGPPAATGFQVTTPDGLAEPGPYVVVTGTLPDAVAGSAVTSVEVGGSTRGVRLDVAHGVWTYVLAHDPGDVTLSIVAKSTAGATAPLAAHVTLGGGTAPARDLGPGVHTVGSWMFTWFTGDTSWRCNSPWQPPGGFATWDGSAAWARTQLLDQMDAHLDLIGLQLDTDDATGPEGYRWTNVTHVIEAARGLWEEGYAPPRVFPFLDTAIIAQHWMDANGTTLDLSSDAGRAYLYAFAHAFYQAASTTLGATYEPAAVARWQGRPYVGMWHSVTIDNESDASVMDFKARFHGDFGSDPYLVAHPNDWRLIPSVDEITLMFGPPMNFYSGGHDAAGAPTINVEAGFWNPVSNTFYLPREGGSHYDDAWASALAARATSSHVYIDSWNETGEGSGIFEAQPVTYAATDTGPCGSFANLHAEAWGDTSRHYIDVTRTNASAWNDAPDLDAIVLASDVPATMRAGEQRWVTIVMQNTGDATWSAGGPGLVARGAETFGVATPVAPLGDVRRGHPAVITVLLTAPCTPGSHALRLGMTGSAGAFGAELSATVTVTP